MAILRQTVYIASLVPLAMANIRPGGFFSVGDSAPWGLPDSLFGALSQANATGSFSVPAYNLSSPNPSIQGDGRSWNIEISLQTDIPLTHANNSGLNAAEEKEFTQFVSMSLNNVDKTEIAKIASSNKMCGYVMFNLKSNATAGAQDDASKGGKCAFLSQQCQDDLQTAVRASGPNCDSITIPDSCSDWIGVSSDDAFFPMTAFEFTKETFTNNRFFSFGLPPASANNVTDYDAAVENVWPVMFTWTHFSNTSGFATTTSSALRCLRPSNITSGSRIPPNTTTPTKGDKPNGAAGTSVPTLLATLLLTGVASGLMFL